MTTQPKAWADLPHFVTAVFGWTLVYLVGVELFVRVAATSWTDGFQCWPYWSTFGVVETRCKKEVLNWMWNGLIAFPHMVALFPQLAIAEIRGAGLSRIPTWLIQSNYLKLSIPMAVVLFVGYGYWHRRSLTVGLAMLALVTVLITLGGLEM